MSERRQVTKQQLADALNALGIDPGDVTEVHLERSEIRVTRRLRVTEHDGAIAHTTTTYAVAG